jgi:hypothetical protein
VLRELEPIFTHTQYNITKQLQEKLEFPWHVDHYISDAEKDGDRDTAEVFRKIGPDEQKHAQMLKELVMRFRITT